MNAVLPLADGRADGPSWSPYLAIGLFLLFAVILGIRLMKKRRR
ncbi:hypothetical protein [Streptomyces sp. NPDC088785]